PAGQDQPVPVRLPTVRLDAAEVRLKYSVLLLRVSMERESNVGQGVARSDCVNNLAVAALRDLAALRVYFLLHPQWSRHPALANRRPALQRGLHRHDV